MQPLIIFFFLSLLKLARCSDKEGNGKELQLRRAWENKQIFVEVESNDNQFRAPDKPSVPTSLKHLYASALINPKDMFCQINSQDIFCLVRSLPGCNNLEARYLSNYLEHTSSAHLPIPYRMSFFVPANTFFAYGMLNVGSHPCLAAILVCRQWYRTLFEVRRHDYPLRQYLTAFREPILGSLFSGLVASSFMHRVAHIRKSLGVGAAIPFVAVTCADGTRTGMLMDGNEERTLVMQYFTSLITLNFSIYGVPPILMSLLRTSGVGCKLPYVAYQGLYLMTIAACARYLVPVTQSLSPFILH